MERVLKALKILLSLRVFSRKEHRKARIPGSAAYGRGLAPGQQKNRSSCGES
jgi:hypothetical protein